MFIYSFSSIFCKHRIVKILGFGSQSVHVANNLAHYSMMKIIPYIPAHTCCEPVSLLTPLWDKHCDVPVATPPKHLHSECYSSTGKEPMKAMAEEREVEKDNVRTSMGKSVRSRAPSLTDMAYLWFQLRMHNMFFIPIILHWLIVVVSSAVDCFPSVLDFFQLWQFVKPSFQLFLQLIFGNMLQGCHTPDIVKIHNRRDWTSSEDMKIKEPHQCTDYSLKKVLLMHWPNYGKELYYFGNLKEIWSLRWLLRLTPMTVLLIKCFAQSYMQCWV